MALTVFPFTVSRPHREWWGLSTRGRDLNDGLVDRASQFGGPGTLYRATFKLKLPKDGETVDSFNAFVKAQLGTTPFTYKPHGGEFKTVTLEDVGTGDGTEDTFVLDSKYIDASTLLVYVNSVLQTLTTHYTFTLNETTPTLTFVTPPPNTEAVEATYERYFPCWFVDDDMRPLLQRGGATSATLPHQLDQLRIAEQFPGAHLVG